MTLQVIISTYGLKGLERTAQMKLPSLEGVSYLVAVQNPDTAPFDIPRSLLRDDITVKQHPGRGLSANRNFGLDHATGDILLIADDDLNYSAEGLQSVIDVFKNDPQLDFATFRYSGSDNKTYPEHPFDFKLAYPKGFYLTSFELALRRVSLPVDVRFPLDFGIGAPVFGSGEEDIFLRSLIKKGLHGCFFPVTITEHPGFTTGSRESTAPVLRAQGALMRIHYGLLSGFMHLLRDVPRRNAPFFKALRYMTEGFMKVKPSEY
ncbi:MAG: glycosyltransferase [Muribaculaceae bacterium]|nr:glycosyltransferase [Muribaculaceae bacterium]